MFGTYADDQVVLGREEVEATMPAILEAHGIAEDRSKDVRDRSILPRQVPHPAHFWSLHPNEYPKDLHLLVLANV